jgi:hypothetical protein
MKRRDFARERRLEGRALTKAVRELAALAVPSAAEQGIDLQARLREGAAERERERQRLAERLQQSVVPLFITDDCPRPRRIGSCVLIRLETEYYAFTAAHVIEEIGSSRVWAPSTAAGGKLLPLPGCTAHLSPAGSHLDVGVLVLTSDNLGPFQEHVFLAFAGSEWRRDIPHCEEYHAGPSGRNRDPEPARLSGHPWDENQAFPGNGP